MAIQSLLSDLNKELNGSLKAINTNNRGLNYHYHNICKINNYISCNDDGEKFQIKIFSKNNALYMPICEINKLEILLSRLSYNGNSTVFNHICSHIIGSNNWKGVNNNTKDNEEYFIYNGVIYKSYLIGDTFSYYLLVYNEFSINEFINMCHNNIQYNSIEQYNNLYDSYKLLNELFEFNIIDHDHDSKKQLEYLNNLESKFDKKFNDLFENTSDIIKELKQDLNIKNEKIRNLELEVHYLKSQSEKKITIDYNAIKQKNKLLNNEFRRMFKLMKFNNE